MANKPGRPKKQPDEQVSKPAAPILSAEDRGLADRIAAQDTDWFAISEEEMTDFSLMVNPMDLKQNYPEAAVLQEEKKFAFRFCERDPKRVDELTRTAAVPLRWAVCNKTNAPFLEKYVDPILGGVCCLDQILLFKPWHHHQMVLAAKQDLAEARSNAPEEVATRNADGKVEFLDGEKAKIAGGDQLFDSKKLANHDTGDNAELGDLLVDE